jgi:ABC-2 type transport system permease protein
MMMRGLWKLTWIEIKIFLREPLGAFGTIGFPVLFFLLVGRTANRRLPSSSFGSNSFIRVDLPVLASLLIAVSAVLSLVTIISIYREGGILKRLRATPLRPQTILIAHVIVKLTLTAATLALMVLAGKRYYPVGVHAPLFSFTIALLISTWRLAFSSPASFLRRVLRSRSVPSFCTQCSQCRDSSYPLHRYPRCSRLLRVYCR